MKMKNIGILDENCTFVVINLDKDFVLIEGLIHLYP